MKPRPNPYEWKFSNGLIAVFFLLGMALAFLAGINAQVAIHVESNASCGFINKGNIQDFCNYNNFTGGWNSCDQDTGFTCYSSAGEYRRYKCFSYDELYQFEVGRVIR